MATAFLNRLDVEGDTVVLPYLGLEEGGMAGTPVAQKLEDIEKNLSDLDGRIKRIEQSGILRWMKDYGMLVVPITLTILGSVFAATVWVVTHAVDDRVESKLTEHHFDQVAADVNGIKGQLGEISAFLKILTENELHRQASLPKQDFEQQVPTLAAAVTTARAVQAYAAPSVIRDINRRLVDTPSDSPGYWNAASQLISYRSDLQVKFKPESLPDCLGGERVPNSKGGGNYNGYWQTTIVLSHCRLNIGIEDLPAFRALAAHVISGIPFEAIHYSLDLTDVRVVYRGGEILPVDMIVMHNCRFEIETRDEAPAQGKTLTKDLLAADEPTIRVNLS